MFFYCSPVELFVFPTFLQSLLFAHCISDDSPVAENLFIEPAQKLLRVQTGAVAVPDCVEPLNVFVAVPVDQMPCVPFVMALTLYIYTVSFVRFLSMITGLEVVTRVVK